MAQWRKATPDETYSPDDIAARLKDELPHWTYEDGWIRRKYKTTGWKATLMVVNTVGHLAEAAWHHPDLAPKHMRERCIPARLPVNATHTSDRASNWLPGKYSTG